MKTIVHTCSSILIRPNGIVRYINTVMKLQRLLGHRTIFVSDARTDLITDADILYYTNPVSQYIPNMKDDHVWLQVDKKVIEAIKASFIPEDVDLVIAHDLHSYLAVSNIHNNGIFVQHEGDVMNGDQRQSYIDDQYLAMQLEVVRTVTNWRIGLPTTTKNVTPFRAVYTPPPFELENLENTKPSKGLLYIGDSSDRKGAQEFMNMAKQLGVRPTVITHDRNPLFEGADVYSFHLNEKEKMFDLMKKHKVAYIPSKQECFSLAVLECAQFMPVVVDGQYNWTNDLHRIGVQHPVGDLNIRHAIQQHLSSDHIFTNQSRMLLEAWSYYAKEFWKNLLT